MKLFIQGQQTDNYYSLSQSEREVNVKSFGAAGNGIVDDTAAINNALNQGLNIYFPSGTYLVTGIVLKYGQRIRGESRANTIIKSTTNAPIISFGSGNVDFVYISDLKILGSQNAGVLQHGIAVLPAQSSNHICRVHIHSCGGNGIDFSGVITNAGNDEWNIENSKIQSCSGYGISCTTQLATSVFTNIECYANTKGGWLFDSELYPIDGLTFIRCLNFRNESPLGAICNGWDIKRRCNGFTWLNCWSESSGSYSTPDDARISSSWRITTGGNANLLFINPRSTVQTRSFWISNNTTGVKIDSPTFAYSALYRSSADILIEKGSSAEILNPKSAAGLGSELIIASFDINTIVRFFGVQIPAAGNRVARGAVYEYSDGTINRILTGGVTEGLYGGVTWSGTAGSNVITAASGHTLMLGDHIIIPGGGTAGVDLHAYITDMAMNTLAATIDRNLVQTITTSLIRSGNYSTSTSI